MFQITGYYCDKDVDIEKLNIGELSFHNKMKYLNVDFTFKDYG